MSRELGAYYEERAANYLIANRYTIVEQNFTTKMGEIDIIATRDNVYHFVEVKGGIGFEPVYNITPAKLRKLIKTVYAYLKLHRLDVAFVIDAIIIQDNALEFIENITL
ncbi:MAG: hypothetical protein KU28_01085 [Sulfurovum sp. PC08-66]|nr:MAG: hypothetical protein KU28_01085 [Sulfurovum sp. PC08-66]KIM12550.1 MAG: hypothetical protein KU37_01200 [Sulfuricurvum sp. PC08-66]